MPSVCNVRIAAVNANPCPERLWNANPEMTGMGHRFEVGDRRGSSHVREIWGTATLLTPEAVRVRGQPSLCFSRLADTSVTSLLCVRFINDRSGEIIVDDGKYRESLGRQQLVPGF